MRITDILDPRCIKVPLTGADKQQAIYELIDLLAEHGRAADVDTIKQAVWQRECTRTTGIGHGIAIPHGKCDCCGDLVMAIGRPEPPIDFQSIDGQPVRIIFLLLSHPDQTGPHIQMLARISRLMTDEDFRAAIEQAADADEVYRLIQSHDTASD